MPTWDAPTHYERSAGIADSKFDPFFRYLASDKITDNTGDIDSPLGFVYLLELTEELIQDFYESVRTLNPADHSWVRKFKIPDPGWYNVRFNSDGLVWGIQYGTDTLAEEKARKDFAEACEVYSHWMEEDEED